MVSLRSFILTCFTLCFLLAISPPLLATDQDSNIDLELRLAPPRTNDSNKEPPAITDKTLISSNQVLQQRINLHDQTRVSQIDRGLKRKRGRPSFDMTEEEKMQRRKKQVSIKNQRYYASVKKDPERHERRLKRKRESLAMNRKKKFQDPKIKAEYLNMRRRHNRNYHAKRKLKRLNEKSALKD